jgi:hypothetical protein
MSRFVAWSCRAGIEHSSAFSCATRPRSKTIVNRRTTFCASPPHLLKPLDQAAPQALREEKWRAAIGAGGNELKFTGTVNAVVEGHGAGEYTLDGAGPEENVPSGSQTPKGRCLRQPRDQKEGKTDRKTSEGRPMNRRNLFPTIFGLAALPMLVGLANAQVTEQAAREQARNIVRSELRSTLNFRPDQFFGIHRDEELEQSLAVATIGWQAGPEFIYKVSPTGVEIKQNAIVNHISVDVDFMYIVAVSSRDGSTFRIHGFGLAESLAEFERLMTTLRVHVASPDQAEPLAEFYREVNPENYDSLAPILSLMELKQAAERQCQSGAKSFDADEKLFAAWWKHAEPLCAALPFQERAVPHGSGYLVEWIVLSSPSRDNCGGAPLQVQLEVSSDGHVGKPTFSPPENR